RYLIVANAANAAIVSEELTKRAEQVARPVGGGTTVSDQTADYALIAFQGPRSAAILAAVSGMTTTELDQVRYYASYQTTVAGADALLARTGTPGEDGCEICTGPQAAVPVWRALTEAGRGERLVPAGLAARDSLRLEAGMPLYGNELSRDVTPFEAGLGRVVKLDKPGDFVGRAALADRARTGPTKVLVGLAGRTRRVPSKAMPCRGMGGWGPRHGYAVLRDGEPCGTVTSGTPSPTLGRPIAMAYLTAEAAEAARSAIGSGGGPLAVDIRGSAEPADLVPLPFYKRPA